MKNSPAQKNEPGRASVPALMAELARAGIRLKLVGESQLQVSAQKGRLSDELRERIGRRKQELIDWLTQIQQPGPDQTETPVIVHDADNQFEPFPPSDLQASFLMGSHEGFEYYVRPHQYGEFDFAELDPARYEAALNKALRRQRKNIVVVRPDMMLETVRDPGPARVTVSDLRHLPEDAAQQKMMEIRAAMQRQEPQFDRWPWLQPHICLYGQGRARLYYNNNNIFTDAPSGTALITAALHYYHHPDQPLPDPEISYRDCVLALADLEKSPLGKASERYWLSRVADWPSAPEVPLVPGSEHRGRSKLCRRELVFAPQVWETVQRKAAARGLTATSTLVGAHAEVLAYWSGSRHFLLNNMITHRQLLHPQLDHVLGNFASLYPLEIDWRPSEPFHHRVRRLQGRIMDDVAHGYYSGVKVLQALSQARRAPGRAACPFAVGSALFAGRVERPFYSTLETPQTLIDTEFWELPDGSLWVVWDVIEAMFPDGLIDAMDAAYRQVITRLAADDSAWEQSAFDLLPAGQRAQRAALNRQVSPASTGLLHAGLARQAAAVPGKPAVVTADGTLSYDELHRRATRLATLLRERGVRPGDRTAVVLPKGWEQVVSVLAVLSAGAAYVPLDPAWPNDRITYLLEDAGATAVLTSEELHGRLAALVDVPVLAADGPQAGTDARDAPADHLHDVPRQPDDLAYVIYTSGSTGKPKGAMLSHRGPLGTITDINRRFGIGSGDVFFGISSLCFDLSVYDVFGAIEAGATLVLPTAARSDPAAWVETVRTRGVTVWNSVPAVMELFAEAAASAGVQFPALRTVLLSGDWIPVQLPELIRRVAPNARIVSLGGATEASIWSICYPIEHTDPGWVSIPYGKPLANQTWHVLDQLGRDAPTWVSGELYIGGAGLALGYLNEPAKTQAAFITHPGTGERLYRTGDLGRYLPSGDIEFLGRTDFQVKIQGFRVELGEIEHALTEHRGIRQAAVVARASGSGKQLAAFVTGTGHDHGLTQSALQAFLAGRLPRYMVPEQITVLDQLPLTANGKLDRRTLESLRPAGGDADSDHAAARTPTEATLAEIWESVLETSPIGVHDNFFDLGGQSFAALRVIGMITQRLGRKMPLGTMLERPTIADLAEWLDRPEDTWSPLVRLNETPAGDPWFLVHPAGGNVLCYRGLADLLGVPCYGFQAPGPASGREPLEKTEDLAARYVQALLEVRPHGPYHLGGWSSGAVIAFEMARQLEVLGTPADRVVVIDAPAPVVPRAIDEQKLLLWFLEDLDIGFEPGRVTAGQAAELAAAPADERLARALAIAHEQDAGVNPDGLSHAELAATLAVFRGVVRACNSYLAPRIGADITVLRADRNTVSEFADHPFADSPDWGWSSLTTGQVTAQRIPGSHHTLLTHPSVSTVTQAITGNVPAGRE